eukprot:2441602-Rhodomonas_salina.2
MSNEDSERRRSRGNKIPERNASSWDAEQLTWAMTKRELVTVATAQNCDMDTALTPSSTPAIAEAIQSQ